MATTLRAALAMVSSLFLALLIGASPATAADDLSIGHVEPAGDSIQILVSVAEGTKVDRSDLTVTVNGVPAAATAELAADSEVKVRRTTVLAIDTSDSMAKNGRFDAAKAAATTFLDHVPDDVYVGIVTFDGTVETALSPTLNRDDARAAVTGLELSRGTLLNDGVIEALDIAGTEGQRNVLVLSDGRDTGDTTADTVVAAIDESGASVDVVALDQTGAALKPLRNLATAGEGAVISADPEALTAAFSDEAASLARQVMLTAELPAEVTDNEATVEVSAPAGSRTVSADTFAVIRGDGLPEVSTSSTDNSRGLQIPKEAMYGGLGALGVGLLLLFGVLLAGNSGPKTVEDRIAAYTGGSAAAGAGSHRGDGQGLGLDQAKGAAASVLRHNKGLEARIETRLEAAGSAFKPAEWLLLHAAIAMLAGLVGMVLGGGDLLLFVGFLLLGAFVPWFWLGMKRRKRVKKFNSGLADTLTLMAGSLSAGMSMAQSLDSVVAEGNEPIAGEFRRVLAEARLGVGIEDALNRVAERMGSKDFEWVVMAIRIQREVGGNLAELLKTVAGTLRERDYLRRQISSLSAEGRLSAYILGGMPPAMVVYMLLVRREYIMPLFTEPMGLLMLLGAITLLSIGGFMMSRMVKVEI